MFLMVLVVLMVLDVSNGSSGSNGSVCVAVPAGSSSSRQDAEHLDPEGIFTPLPFVLQS